ncbi:MAG: SDR family NAD(P)-dependent oxidoreductase [Kocuria sp.]|nr:SDR family NAD(P)-dependent oxidoreductase [Kocuria sp.]
MRNSLRPFALPSQAGKTWLVTGATHGLGREVAQAAAAAGARVIVTARDDDRGNAVASTLSNARVLKLDLADLTSVQQAAAAVDEPVHVLVNNAGTVCSRRCETVDGFEVMLGTNVLGPFAFTNLVLPQVKERVVIVGSGAHRWATLDLGDPHFSQRKFSFRAGYGQSKLACLLWGLGLSQRLRDHATLRSGVQLAHPGWAHTNLHHHASHKLISTVVDVTVRWGGQSAADGAQSILAAATWQLPECSYVGPAGRGELKGAPCLVKTSAKAADPALADAFWELAEHATGTYFPAV